MLIRYNERFTLTQDGLDVIATYMNDDIRENLHLDIAGCTPEEFLVTYLNEDPGFAELLKSEFHIELEEGEN